MFATVARPLYRTATRFTSTTISNRVLSSRSIDKKPKVVSRTRRRVSTSPLPSETKAPRNSEPPLGASGLFLDVRIPPPEVYPEPPVQVPYVPDFWDSAKPIPDAPSTGIPIVVVVGGTKTSHGSVYPHAPEDISVPLESDSAQVSQETERSDSFLDDVAEDLHLPPIQEIKSSILKIFS